MNYRIFYYEYTSNGDKIVKSRVIGNPDMICNYDVFYMTDMNGEVIIDKRGE